MRAWDYRPDEVKNLFNPAFCGRVIYGTISEYQKNTKRDFPFPLIYLVLPLVLPRQIRTEISSRTQLTNWVQKHQELIYNLGKRVRDLVEITNEAVKFMMQTGYIRLNDSGELSKVLTAGALSKTKHIDPEVAECLQKAEHVGRWFAGAGKVEIIYTCLGVRP
ncbi:three component ABC system middle component [Pyramidobacter sp.]|uniref:three component ABC system middle component n=1 Tax=Pyramidobacter sp. TaxID=1943581 RepID=UPI003319810C